MVNRVFLIVLDSFGIGEAPDSVEFGDTGSNTLGSVSQSLFFSMPECRSLGLLNIEGTDLVGAPFAGVKSPRGCFARMREASRGKDTTIGHWEISGIISHRPLPTYPNGFPPEVIAAFEAATGKKTICNRPYSGTDVIRDYGDEHQKTGALIIYTSADSVFQIAAHEALVPHEELYEHCRAARAILCGEHAVGRVIARPFGGSSGAFVRTAGRHDFSLLPPKKTMGDFICDAGLSSIGIGKIFDIFAGQGITKSLPTTGNRHGMDTLLSVMNESFRGLCFVNLVDFDMVYGHRNDVAGYARALSEFDSQLSGVLCQMREDDVIIITADHGCDPATPSTDHSREYVPMVAFGAPLRNGADLKTRTSFADIGSTVLELLGVPGKLDGQGFGREITTASLDQTASPDIQNN